MGNLADSARFFLSPMNLFFRPTSLRGLLLIGLGLLIASVGSAQPRRLPPNLQDPDQLRPEEGAKVLAAFRETGPVGDVVADFALTFEPYRDTTRHYEGRFFGTWIGAPRTRVVMSAQDDFPLQRWILWNGPEPRAWRWDASGEASEAQEIGSSELFSPLIPGTTLTPFDLQMPFIYWNDYAYEGTRRVKGRAAHFFLLYPPAEDARYAAIGGVRVVLDADFNALLSAEILDPDGKELKRIAVQSFKKLNDQWIVKRIDLIDEVSRDRTRFELLAASVGPLVDPRWFRPESLSESALLPGVLDRL